MWYAYHVIVWSAILRVGWSVRHHVRLRSSQYGMRTEESQGSLNACTGVQWRVSRKRSDQRGSELQMLGQLTTSDTRTWREVGQNRVADAALHLGSDSDRSSSLQHVTCIYGAQSLLVASRMLDVPFKQSLRSWAAVMTLICGLEQLVYLLSSNLGPIRGLASSVLKKASSKPSLSKPSFQVY